MSGGQWRTISAQDILVGMVMLGHDRRYHRVTSRLEEDGKVKVELQGAALVEYVPGQPVEVFA